MSYLFAGFCVIWLVLYLYVLSVSRRQRTLAREVEALKQRMAQHITPKSS